MTGAPEVVLVRGQVIVEGDELVAEPGAGQFVKRARFGEELLAQQGGAGMMRRAAKRGLRARGARGERHARLAPLPCSSIDFSAGSPTPTARSGPT